ncbi:MAG TPA: hypothetical protein VGC89_11905 [Pyrinomonadaceae bacterium]|jgi:hypothetical protein
MSEQSGMADDATDAPRDLDFEQARLAYSIIQNLLEHTSIISDLIALMAQALDEDTTKALTKTPHWNAYLDSRRTMERTREEIEKFADIMKRLSTDASSDASAREPDGQV